MTTIPPAPIPAGLCQCGCGQATEISRQTRTARGEIKGQPQRYRTGHHLRSPMVARFWANVRKTDSCWLWIGSFRGAYGCLSVHNRTASAHKTSWELHNGPVARGMMVCHNCPSGDNPACVNPDHLFLGSALDNMIDKVVKGRAYRGKHQRAHGAQHGQAKLTDDKVRTVRERYAHRGCTLKQLGAEYGVGADTICDIVRRKTWKHVSP